MGGEGRREEEEGANVGRRINEGRATESVTQVREESLYAQSLARVGTASLLHPPGATSRKSLPGSQGANAERRAGQECEGAM